MLMVVELPRVTVGQKTYTIDLRLRELRCISGRGMDFIRLSPMHAELIEHALKVKDHDLLVEDVKEAIADQKGASRASASR